MQIVSFGCRLNAHESERMAAQAAAEGLTGTVVFNTCAVTAEAVRQARQAIRKARRERPDGRLVVTGCAAQIDPAAFGAMDGVALVVPNAEKTRPGALAGTSVAEVPVERRLITDPIPAPSRRARAYVEIQNGCDHRCTFCVIPYGRGDSRSTPGEAVAAQVRALAEAGCAEVVLTGVDLTSWGDDLAGRPRLGDLVRAVLAAAPGLLRLRLSSVDAAEIDGELLALMAGEARLMPHLHLSLQSGDDLILKRMKRRHSRQTALDLIGAVRDARPDTAFGADFIAGFPTESEAAFDNTVAFVEEAGLAFLHVFPYSARPGTPAARMPPVPPGVIGKRAARLRAAGEAALARHLDVTVGRPIRALVERPGQARAEDFTRITFAGEATPGAVIAGRIAGHDGASARLETWERAA